jgi:MOSC domain-containing protein YiiM
MRAHSGEPRPEASADAVRLVSVNVSLPCELGRIVAGGREVTVHSGIDKRPVGAGTLYPDRENLEGDGQADLRVHGGRDKAVYAYPADHWPAWSDEEEREFGPAAFGENLTVGGVNEEVVCIGDVWAWGEALLQVACPRSPCYKLGIRMGRQALRRWVREEGLVGWYLRVLRPGTVPTSGTIVVAERHPAGVTVLEVHRAIDGGGIGPAHLQTLQPLAEKARRKLQVGGRDVTGGVPERDG